MVFKSSRIPAKVVDRYSKQINEKTRRIHHWSPYHLYCITNLNKDGINQSLKCSFRTFRPKDISETHHLIIKKDKLKK